MTIEQIDESKVLISLCNEDLEDFSLNTDTMSFSDPHSRKILGRLLTLACNKTGLCIQKKPMLVEALPHDSGCLILITLNKNKKRKTYKIKTYKHSLCYKFDNLEGFLSSIEFLYKTKINFHGNNAYFYNNNYYLIFNYPVIPIKAKAILNEHSKALICNKSFVARLCESGKIIAKGNAINIIGKAF